MSSIYIKTKTHEWTPFELSAVFGLLCKHRHLHQILTFTTELNEVLNGNHRRFDQDITTDDVRQLLIYLQKSRKYACKWLAPRYLTYVLIWWTRFPSRRMLPFSVPSLP